MCGIVGIVNFNKGNSDLTSRVNSMAEEIVHRGPDFKAIFKNNMGVFGFLRLSIIDLSENANQPFQSDDLVWHPAPVLVTTGRGSRVTL